MSDAKQSNAEMSLAGHITHLFYGQFLVCIAEEDPDQYGLVKLCRVLEVPHEHSLNYSIREGDLVIVDWDRKYSVPLWGFFPNSNRYLVSCSGILAKYALPAKPVGQ